MAKEMILMSDKLTLELKKEFGTIAEMIEYLERMTADIKNGKIAETPTWQIYIAEAEDSEFNER
jgi:hypothetical protein